LLGKNDGKDCHTQL